MQATKQRLPPIRPRRGMVSGCVAILLWLAATPAWGLPDAPDGMGRLSSIPFSWSESRQTWLSDVSAHLRSFTSTLPMLRSAEILVSRSPLFRRAIVFNDRMVLSGMDGRWHWVAELEARGGGSAGLISALDIGDPAARPGTDQAFGAVRGCLPPQAQLRFSQSSTEGGRRVAQQIYSIPGRWEQIEAHIHRQLRRQGWHASPGAAGLPGNGAWSRAASRLVLIPVATTAVPSLFVQYLE